MIRCFKLIIFIFLFSGCSPETSNNISGALNNITRMGVETLKDSLDERRNSAGTRSTPKAVCMWNPKTQGMSKCHHLTAGGSCAHYGAPCS